MDRGARALAMSLLPDLVQSLQNSLPQHEDCLLRDRKMFVEGPLDLILAWLRLLLKVLTQDRQKIRQDISVLTSLLWSLAHNVLFEPAGSAPVLQETPDHLFVQGYPFHSVLENIEQCARERHDMWRMTQQVSEGILQVARHKAILEPGKSLEQLWRTVESASQDVLAVLRLKHMIDSSWELLF
ncbi:unnamed protein product [Symbiodinium sp. CCMP2592]|nr:unnamed protein product [Symbiodinium sp. CCMP2592]